MTQRSPQQQLIHDIISGSCLWISGDIGGLTFYTRRNGEIVSYPSSPPESPPTPAQLAQRQRFADVATAWHALTQAKRDAWNRTQHKAYLGITGYNLFTWYMLTPDSADRLATIAKQAGETIP
jgi:hypothetical protein